MITVKTRTGSIYRIDPVNVEWERINAGEKSVNNVRTQGGKLYFLPELEVGKPLQMACPSTAGGIELRVIETSEIEEIDWGANDPVQYMNGSVKAHDAKRITDNWKPKRHPTSNAH